MQAPSKKQSTNEKINSIINDRPIDTEDDLIRSRTAELAAKNRIRRGALYGAGARAKIPKIKVILYDFVGFILIICHGYIRKLIMDQVLHSYY